MAGHVIPHHDLIVADRPEENIEVFSYYLEDTLVMTAKVTYADASKREIESVEYSYGE